MLGAETPVLSRADREDAWRAIVELASRDERRPAPRLRVVFALAAVASCLLALGVWLSRSGGPAEARMSVVRGSARVVGQPHVHPGSGMERLSLPAQIEVRQAGEARVVLARGVRLRIAAATRARVRSDGVDLESGEVRHRVAKGRGAWSTSLGRYRVIVLGTEYWTARRGTEAAVCVTEGRVRVIDPAGVAVATLGAGEAWRSSAEAPQLPTDLPCSAVAQARPEGVAMADGAGAVGPAFARPAIGGESDGRPDAAALSSTPTGASPGTHDEGGDVGAAAELSGRNVAGSAPPDRDIPVPAGVAATGAAEVAPPATAPVQHAVTAASSTPPTQQHEAGPDRAPPPPQAEADQEPVSDLALQTAAYRLGLSRRRAGDAPGAIAAWLEYRRRWPGGALAPEADLGVLEMRLSSGSSEALAEATRFLRVHPGSERRGDVLAIRAQLLHRAGQHGEALGDYDAALAGRASARRRQEAAFGRAACLDALGRREEARAAYREILERNPEGRFTRRAREALAEPAR
jgi:TolA-binding protein